MTGEQKQSGQAERSGERVGLVLSGGGARGAYELGALSALVPVLERRGQRPRIIVGTSVGALNAAYLAAAAHDGWENAVEAGCQLWRNIKYGDVLGSLVSARDLGLVLRFGLEFVGAPIGGVPSLLDNSPLADTVKARVCFGRLAGNVQSGVIDTVAVAATSYETGRSVVFYDSSVAPPRDDKRAIDYAPTSLAAAHVRASAAIEALFPAVEVMEPAEMGGWYGDGGTSLNTPLKPALKFGAERLIVIGLNSTAGTPSAAAKRPADFFDGAAQALQALLADQLAHDVATLATINQTVAARQPDAQGAQTGDERRVIPYIFVAPRERFAVGRLASEIYRQRYAGLGGLRRAHNLALLGRLLDVPRNLARSELFSYVCFAAEFADALIEQGRRDAEWWLEQDHDDWPWRLGDPPVAQGNAPQPGHAGAAKARPLSRAGDERGGCGRAGAGGRPGARRGRRFRRRPGLAGARGAGCAWRAVVRTAVACASVAYRAWGAGVCDRRSAGPAILYQPDLGWAFRRGAAHGPPQRGTGQARGRNCQPGRAGVRRPRNADRRFR
jgi:NTE family protein